MEENKNKVYVYCGTIELGGNQDVNRVIINALIEDRYEVTVKPVFNEYHHMINEIIDIYEVNDRHRF